MFLVIKTFTFYPSVDVKFFLTKKEAISFVKADIDREAEEFEKTYELPAGSLLKQNTSDYSYACFMPHAEDDRKEIGKWKYEREEWRITEMKTPALESLDIINDEDPWDEGGSWSIVCAEEEPLEDLTQNASDAAQEYLNTFSGWKYYHKNLECFDWVDFYAFVPDSICRKHGFTLLPVTGIQTEVSSLGVVPESRGFAELLSEIPAKEVRKSSDILWTDGSSVFCETEEEADQVMDWLADVCSECAGGKIPVKALGDEDENGVCPWNVTLCDHMPDTVE